MSASRSPPRQESLKGHSTTKISPFDKRSSTKVIDRNSPHKIYKNASGTKSPSSHTKEQSLMNNTMTSDWKTGLSPRARGRMHIALPTDNNDNTTDYHDAQ